MSRKKNFNDVNDNEQVNMDSYYEPDVDDIINEFYPKPKQKRKRRKSSDEFYVKGADLLEEIKKYNESKKLDAEKRNVPFDQGKGIISDDLAIMIMKICTRFSLHPKFFRLFL